MPWLPKPSQRPPTCSCAGTHALTGTLDPRRTLIPHKPSNPQPKTHSPNPHPHPYPHPAAPTQAPVTKSTKAHQSTHPIHTVPPCPCPAPYLGPRKTKKNLPAYPLTPTTAQSVSQSEGTIQPHCGLVLHLANLARTDVCFPDLSALCLHPALFITPSSFRKAYPPVLRQLNSPGCPPPPPPQYLKVKRQPALTFSPPGWSLFLQALTVPPSMLLPPAC